MKLKYWEKLEKGLYQDKLNSNEINTYLKTHNLYISCLPDVLFLIGAWFTNPFVPDFGVQFALSTAIGLVLPERAIEPINKGIKKIPGIGKIIQKYERKLENHEKIKHIVPRVLAGYVTTYLIGATSLLIYFFCR